ncbi:unnamed protein product [Agarophyton chilense]
MDPPPSANQPAGLPQPHQQRPHPPAFDAQSAAHAAKVCQLIISAINEAATIFDQPPNQAAFTPQQHHLHTFLSSLQPSLSNNINILRLYLQTNIFSLPSNLPAKSLPSLLSSEATLKSNQQKIHSLDSQINTLRAKIHNYDRTLQQTVAKSSQLAAQRSVLSAIQVENLTKSSRLAEHATECIKTSSSHLNTTLASISTIPDTHGNTNQIISAAAAAAAAATTSAASRLSRSHPERPSATAIFQSDSFVMGDEHGPLTTATMPPVANIFNTPQSQEARADQAPQISFLQSLLYGCQ